MKKIKEFIIKNQKILLSILIGIIVIGIVSLSIFSSLKKSRVFKNEQVYFHYPNIWRVIKNDSSEIVLKHSNGSSLEMLLVDLEEENKYQSYSDISNRILSKIEDDNKEYKLIAREDALITPVGYNAIKSLYEKNDYQTLIIISKIDDKIVLFSYEAYSKYFDLLLDSVYGIIYSFQLVNEQAKIAYNLKEIDSTNLQFSKNTDFEKLLTDIHSYQIANNHYIVHYSIPSVFIEEDYNSTRGNYTYKDDVGNISLSSVVEYISIYDLINRNDITYSVPYIREKNSNNKKISSYRDEIKKEKDYYIYHTTYQYDGYDGIEDKELFYIFYPLDSLRTFIITVEANNIKIPEKLISMISFDSKKKYSQYIYRNIEDGNLINELKYKTSDKLIHIYLKTPQKYVECDYTNNVYERRYFGLNRINNFDDYQYNVIYELFNYSLDIKIKSLQENSNIVEKGIVTINNKEFHVYDGQKDGKNEMYLYFVCNDSSYRDIVILGIKITSIDSIDTAMISELTNFELRSEEG